MERLRVVLVDDEINSLQNLQHKLEEFCPEVQILAAVQQPEEAIGLIRELRPDAVFLDIEMPKMSGFRMLEELTDIPVQVIFTTAWNHYAIDAIRIQAFDYLMKPIAVRDLQQAIERLLNHRRQLSLERAEVPRPPAPASGGGLVLGERRSQEDPIAIPTAEGMEFLTIRSIVRIESSSNYSRIYFLKGQPMLVTRLLKEFEELLVPYQFYRVHHSHLINLLYVRKYVRGDGGQVILQNGDEIDVARRKKDEFLRLITR